MTQQLHTGHVSQINEDLCSHRNVYTNVYSSIIGNDKILETIQISFNEWMVKQCVVHPHLEYYPSVKKKQTIFTHNNLYEFNYIIFSKWQNTVMENKWFQEVRAGVYKKKEKYKSRGRPCNNHI